MEPLHPNGFLLSKLAARLKYAFARAWIFILAPFRSAPPQTDPNRNAAAWSSSDIAKFKDAEETMRLVNEQLILAQRFANAGVWDWNIAADRMNWSPELFALFGLNPKTTKANFDIWRAVLHPDDRQAAEQHIDEAIKKRISLKNEYRVILPGGKVRWINALGNTVYGRDGQPERMLGICLDITERKLTQRDLETTKERYQSLFNRMTEGFALNEMIFDRQGNPADYRIIDANSAYERYTNLKREDIVGKLRSQIMPPNPTSLARYGEVVSTGEPAYFENYSQPIQKYNRIYAYRPAPGQFATIFADITESKLAEKALQQSEERSRQIADTMPNIVWIATAAGKIEFTNKTFKDYTGLTCCGENIWDFLPLHPQDRAATKIVWEEASRKTRPYQIEHRVHRSDNAFRWHLSRGVPLLDGSGAVTNWFGTATDIHEIKEAQKELQRADEEKNKFISMMSHELRNPLTPIVTGIELIRGYINEPVPNADTLREMIDEPARIIEEQTKSMTRILDDLLDISRISRGKIDLKKQPVSIGQTLELAAKSVQSLIKKQHHDLQIVLPNASLFVKADPVRLQQIVVNLLNNAIKYTPPFGKIWLEGHQKGNEAWINVRDNGIGINPETADSLFSSIGSARASVPFISTQGEMGIGLKLTKDLVRLHNGIIQANSSGTDQGCEFIVRFPALTQPITSTAASQNNEPNVSAKLKIIVVDDDQNIANLISKALKYFGHDTEICLNGNDAVSLARIQSPDIVLVDIGLPGMDGYQVLRALRRIETESGTPIKIAAVTGYGQKGDKERALAAGFDLHLSKPITMQALKKAITTLS